MNLLMFSKKYHYILLIYTLTLLHQYQEHHLFCIIFSLIQLINRAQSLNIYFLFLLFRTAAVPEPNLLS